ncbi:zinc ABC transporter ATP-binding protein AztA [Nocardia jejuensis]|uniref:zinc ABC transporter ATP-binding protein AztA n=1 Tax=Nocardia jejuensis TaxID=328049 RepID=UPI0008352419|nr:zinc ABC transporter ATP-binding protein AztA [Nocardia jejuensis]
MHNPDAPAIRIDALSAGYPGRTVLQGVSAEIPSGRITAVVGPNGSGKSTLLSVLAGVLAPVSGTIERASRCRPALVVQHSAVPLTLPITVRQTVAMGRWSQRGPWRRLTRHDRLVVRICLDRLGIAELADRRLGALSGGQRQRALLAQALAQESDLLLLDEPASGLDADARRDISELLVELADTGVTVVQATHDDAEASRAHHRLLLHDGHVRAGRRDTPDYVESIGRPVPM